MYNHSLLTNILIFALEFYEKLQHVPHEVLNQPDKSARPGPDETPQRHVFFLGSERSALSSSRLFFCTLSAIIALACVFVSFLKASLSPLSALALLRRLPSFLTLPCSYRRLPCLFSPIYL